MTETPTQPRITRFQTLLAAALTATLLVLAGPGTVSNLEVSSWLALFAWFAFAPILFVLPKLTVRRASLVGFLAGFLTNFGFCLWFPGLMARFNNLNPVLAWLATLAIIAYQALIWLIWAGLLRSIQLNAPKMPTIIVGPAIFVALERWMPLIFPYSLGLTQYQQIEIAQIAELGGPYVITLLLALAGSAIAQTAHTYLDHRKFPVKTVAITLCVIVGSVAFGYVRSSSINEIRQGSPSFRAGIVQPGVVRTGMTRVADDEGLLERTQRLSAQREAASPSLDLLIWPEKAYPLLLRSDAIRDYPEGNDRRIRQGFSLPLIFGLTSVNPGTRRLANSAAFLDRNGSLHVFYDKVELIFYSEWLPEWGEAWFGRRYIPGTRLEPLVFDDRARISVFICFESTFPGHVRRLMSHDPDLLINLTDDSWFGNSSEPEQHLSQAIFRAIESRRDLIRPTGSGVSALVTATGEIETRTDLNLSLDQAETTVEIEARLLNIPSFYATLGDFFPILCALVTIFSILLVLRRCLSARKSNPPCN